MDSIDQRTKKALDDITQILKNISLDRQGRLTIQGLLDDIGYECERQGYEPAKLFVIGKINDSAFEAKQDDLNRLIMIINVLEVNKLPRSKASYILKKLNAVKQFYAPGS